MDNRIARWLQIKRLAPRELERIHKLELDAKCEMGVTTIQGGNWKGYAYAAAAGYLAVLNDQLGPFWDRSKTDEDRAAEVRSFERAVFPIWKSIFERLGDGPEAKYKSELAALHAADWAILRSPYEINRRAGSPIAGSKALSAVYGSSGADRAAAQGQLGISEEEQR